MHDCIMQIGMQKIWKTTKDVYHLWLYDIFYKTRKFKWDVTQESRKLSVNYQNLCYRKSMQLSLKREIFTWERLSIFFFKVTLVPNPRYLKRMWFLRNAEQTLLTTKQYRSFAISGFSSQFWTVARSNLFLLSSYHIIIRTNKKLVLH